MAALLRSEVQNGRAANVQEARGLRAVMQRTKPDALVPVAHRFVAVGA